jgi:hypothetical protein
VSNLHTSERTDLDSEDEGGQSSDTSIDTGGGTVPSPLPPVSILWKCPLSAAYVAVYLVWKGRCRVGARASSATAPALREDARPPGPDITSLVRAAVRRIQEARLWPDAVADSPVSPYEHPVRPYGPCRTGRTNTPSEAAPAPAVSAPGCFR